MTAPAESSRVAAVGRRWWRARARLGARGLAGQTGVLLLLSVLAALVCALTVFADHYAPITLLLVPLLIGSLLLGPRTLPWFVVFVLTLTVVAVGGRRLRHIEIMPVAVTGIAMVFLLGLIVLLMSFRRSRLGVAGIQGESMFVDLRDRILNQGGIPVLPVDWHVQSALASAGGTLFAGDFVVASRPARDRLEVVVVDVSGKGEQAGTRALLLSGAFGGLLGALPPDQFLPAANEYLLRQEWEEGFATAVHLSVNLTTGAFDIRTAGHPPAVWRAAGSGRWSVLSSEGPILGLIPGAEFHVATGVLAHGDAVLLYTDGMVEQPRRDIDLGIDRLVGEAESLLRGNFLDAAQRLVDALGSRNDDRATVVVHRL
ncbi:PP2C family protein-serine/threonine phosphatase [Nocardioides panacihumi]|uniref:PP2C family protein-serine/threonine phosphatase n=1 Tax=Nocardioides panacihumi TaxID=400774 RepID=A0ABP5CIU5_9ACTN